MLSIYLTTLEKYNIWYSGCYSKRLHPEYNERRKFAPKCDQVIEEMISTYRGVEYSVLLA
jgi:hypothetical protein